MHDLDGEGAMQSQPSLDGFNSPVWPGPLKGDPYKVLVVDDDPVCLKMVQQMLKVCNYAGQHCRLCDTLSARAWPLPLQGHRAHRY